MQTATQTALDLKRADLTDAKAWVEDLRKLNPTREQIFCATNYVQLLEHDIKNLEQQLKQEQGKAFPGLVICPNCNNPSERCTCPKRKQS